MKANHLLLLAVMFVSCKKEQKNQVAQTPPNNLINVPIVDTFRGMLHATYVIFPPDGTDTPTQSEALLLSTVCVRWISPDSVCIYDNFRNNYLSYFDGGSDEPWQESGVYRHYFKRNAENDYTFPLMGLQLSIRGDTLTYHYYYSPYRMFLSGGYDSLKPKKFSPTGGYEHYLGGDFKGYK